MTDHAEPQSRLMLWGVIVELGLAVVALVVGALVGFSPVQTVDLAWDALPDHLTALVVGALAAMPMLSIMLLVEKMPVRPLRRLRALVRRWIAPLFAGQSIAGLAVISAAAGFGEEILFRGLLQAGLASWIGGGHGVWIGLVTASLAFGFAHFISWTYVVLASLIGVYLGWLFWASGQLLVPIAAHGLYDFLALLYFVKWTR